MTERSAFWRASVSRLAGGRGLAQGCWAGQRGNGDSRDPFEVDLAAHDGDVGCHRVRIWWGRGGGGREGRGNPKKTKLRRGVQTKDTPTRAREICIRALLLEKVWTMAIL